MAQRDVPSGSPAFLAIREGWPVLITPFLVGVPFGILAREAGLEPLQASGMSVIMFAGASQFVALELFRSGLTDEAFAMGTSWYRRGGRGLAYYVTFAAAMWVLWNVGTIVGVLAGPAVPDPRIVGLDFGITATFIAIVVLGIRCRRDVVIALAAALAAGLLRGVGLGVIAVVVAGALAPLAAWVGIRR